MHIHTHTLVVNGCTGAPFQIFFLAVLTDRSSHETLHLKVCFQAAQSKMHGLSFHVQLGSLPCLTFEILREPIISLSGIYKL